VTDPWASLLERALATKPRIGITPADVVFRENKWRLLRYRPGAAGRTNKTPVLLVPSLINRWYVLDLLPGRSFAEYMVAQGHDVFIIDWGTPGDEDRDLDFDIIADKYLARALRKTCEAAGAPSAHVLGYCLGGTLAAIHAALRPAQIASLVAMAAPIQFVDDGLLSLWTRVKSFDVEALIDGFGNVPWQLMQASFEMLKPTLNMAKSIQLVERASDDQFLDAFFAIETWGHDNVSFPGAAYKKYITELYRDDALVNDKLFISGQLVKLENIACPTLAVTFEHDHIVPHASAAVLLERIGATKKERIHLPGGHVGAVVSQKGAKHLWPKLSEWFSQAV